MKYNIGDKVRIKSGLINNEMLEDITDNNKSLNIKELAKTMTRIEFLKQVDKDGLNDECVRYTDIADVIPKEMFGELIVVLMRIVKSALKLPLRIYYLKMKL